MKRHPTGYLVKLVRDRVGEVLGVGTVGYRSMTHDEHVKRLRYKVLEEALEYATDQTLDELAQVYEAVRALARIAHGCEMADIEALADEQRAERGGFDEGIGMYAFHAWDHE